MRTSLTGAALATVLLAGTAAAERFTFVALGDMPYTLPEDYGRFDRLIAAVNQQQPVFTIHVGDTKAGGTSCADENLVKVRDQLDSFGQPLIYTPGDNEWTDCHRKGAGGFEPLERLAKVRELHFLKPESRGRSPMPLERQADAMPEFATFVENARWVHDGVSFITVHVVGSNNGFERNVASVTEWAQRDAANVAWVKAGFERAQALGASAMVVAFQANPNWAKKPAERYGDDGFRNVLAALATGAEAFGKPVLLIHGDEHVLTIDQPLKAPDGKATLANVTRLQVMGADLVHGVRVDVDTADPAVFGFRPLVVPENLKSAQAG